MPVFKIKKGSGGQDSWTSDGVIWEVVEAVRKHSIAPELLQWSADRNNEVAASVALATQLSTAAATSGSARKGILLPKRNGPL